MDVEKQAKKLERLFNKYDQDKSGVLELDELREVVVEVLKEKYSSEKEIEKHAKKLVKELDVDGDGAVNLVEFAWGMGLKEEVNKWREFFNMLDTNGDGLVGHKELSSKLKSEISKASQEADGLLRAAEKRRGQSLGQDEFVAVMIFQKPLKARTRPTSKPLPETEVNSLLITFETYDTDKSGYLEEKELKRMLRKENIYHCSKHELRVLMKQVDKNGDGKVSRVEFIEMLGFKDEVEHYWQAFLKVDQNKNGRVELEELVQVLQTLGLSQPKKEALRILKFYGRKKSLTFDLFADFMLNYH